MRAIALFLAASILTIGGCGKSEGSACKGTGSVCMSNTEALSCQGGVYAKVSCAGPLGCKNFDDHANCDDSVANEGAACMAADGEHFACSADRKRAFVCKNGRYERELECRGKLGCSLLGARLSCDVSLAQKGDPCKTSGVMACDVDQKHMLECRDGAFALRRYCRGQYGCTLKDDVPACDETVSLEGDPCGMAGFIACSVDGKSELACQGGSFVKTRSCRGPCQVTTRPGRAIDCP